MSEAKLTVIYDGPTDPEAFETACVAEQLEAAREIPGYLRLEASKVWPKEDGMPTAVTTTLAVEREFASWADLRRLAPLTLRRSGRQGSPSSADLE
jgi:hypothetical protein